MQRPAPQQSPGYLLWRTTLAWQRRMRSVLMPHHLTHVQCVLLASLWWLEEHDGHPSTQARLAAQAGTDPMMTSQVIRKLEARGLLERALDPTDARARQLGLTACGRALVASALADVEWPQTTTTSLGSATGAKRSSRRSAGWASRNRAKPRNWYNKADAVKANARPGPRRSSVALATGSCGASWPSCRGAMAPGSNRMCG